MSQDIPPDDPGTDADAQRDDDSGLPSVTRRMALGLLGLGVLAGGETTTARADVGGGPDSDELAHVLRPTYEGPESELPAAGVEGRRFTVTDTGGTYPQWTELRDTGSAWEPINIDLGDAVADSLSTDDTDTKRLGSERHYAGSYDGSDADTRLDNAITAASENQVIYLEEAIYSANRTISKQLTFIGVSNTRAGDGTEITGSWTLSNRTLIKQISGSGSFTFNANYCAVTQSTPTATASFTANNDGFRYVNNTFGNITFASGTTDGIVDGCVLTSVTDKGTNTVGDIS